MTEMVGADVDALEAAAAELRGAADELDAYSTALSGLLGSVGWIGTVASRFLVDWSGSHRLRLSTTAEFIRDTATILDRNAGAQRDASGTADATAAGAVSGGAAGAARPPTQGAQLTEQIAETRNELETELDERRGRLEQLRSQRPDGGPEEFLKDILPGIDADSEKLAADIAAEERAIARLEALLEDPDRQFLKVDVDGDGRIVEVLGDLTEADHVAIHVPGVDTDIDGYTANGHADAAALHAEMSGLAPPGESVAVVAFLDYDPPDNAPLEWHLAAGESRATEGAANLDYWVDHLRDDGFTPDQLTVVGHSYGSTTTGIALEHNNLGVARVAVVGSPGLGGGVDDISDLGRPDVTVYAGKAGGVPLPLGGDGDPITWLPAHGEDPADSGFGATRFDTGSSTGHSQYFEGESLRNLAKISIGMEPTLR